MCFNHAVKCSKKSSKEHSPPGGSWTLLWILYIFVSTLWSICRVWVLSLCSRSHSWDACRLSWSDWVSRADTFSWKTRPQEGLRSVAYLPMLIRNFTKNAEECNVRMKAKSSCLPLGHAAVILRPLLEELLAHGLPLLLQTALPLQLLELQVFKFFGSGLQRLSVLINKKK